MNSQNLPGIAVVGLWQQGTTFADKINKQGLSIHGSDVDASKRNAFAERFPHAKLYEGDGMMPSGLPTIIASNTPDHHRAISNRIQSWTRHILSEKPLALNLKQTQELVRLAQENSVDLYTALLIRFSPAVHVLKEFIQKNDLVMTSGKVVWGKNRKGNKRPTAGDLEDEAVHGIDILLLMASLNQNIESMSIQGQLAFHDYVDSLVQEWMHKLDPSYPLHPNSSTGVVTNITTTHSKINTILVSSFVARKERRHVTIWLAKRDNPNTTLYRARMDFDKRLPELWVEDTLQLWEIGENGDFNKVQSEKYPTDKMGAQTQAWINAVRWNPPDRRLATPADALRVAQWTDAVIRSHESGNQITIS